ncbi:MAG: hypothetical protein F9K43_30660, partial [Bauldia sp.]
MYFTELVAAYDQARRERNVFHDLMRFRVREVLLVGSLYDSFVVESDGVLTEQIYGEYFKLNLNTIPRVTCAYDAESAKDLFYEGRFDLVILMAGLQGAVEERPLPQRLGPAQPEHRLVEQVALHIGRLGRHQRVALDVGNHRLVQGPVGDVRRRVQPRKHRVGEDAVTLAVGGVGRRFLQRLLGFLRGVEEGGAALAPGRRLALGKQRPFAAGLVQRNAEDRPIDAAHARV